MECEYSSQNHKDHEAVTGVPTRVYVEVVLRPRNSADLTVSNALRSVWCYVPSKVAAAQTIWASFSI